MMSVCHMFASLSRDLCSSGSLVSPRSPHLLTLSVVTKRRGSWSSPGTSALETAGPVHTGRWWRGGRVLSPAPAPPLPLLLAQDQCCHLSWPSRVLLGLGFVQQTLLCPHPHQDLDLVTDISSSESSCCVDVYEVSRNNAFGWYGMLHGSSFCVPSYAAHKNYWVSVLGGDETKVDTTRSVSAESGVPADTVSLVIDAPFPPWHFSTRKCWESPNNHICDTSRGRRRHSNQIMSLSLRTMPSVCRHPIET